MPTALAPDDRKLLMVAGLILAVLTVVALLSSPSNSISSPGFPSSYSAANDGAKAAYLLLGEMGYRAERWTSPPQDLPGLIPAGSQRDADASSASKGTVLVLVDPLVPASADERSSLRDFVLHGGRVLTTGEAGAALVSEPPPRLARGTVNTRFRTEQLAPLTRNAPEIVMNAHHRWASERPDQMACYGDEKGAVVVAYRLGKGAVIWWADAGPLTNRGITQGSNLMLFLNSIGASPGARVLWDEYYHGERPGFWSYLGHTPVPGALAQVALVLVAALVTYGRRHGPVRLLRRRSRLSPLEFVETMGDLYRRAAYPTGAFEVVHHRFRSLLQRRLGLPVTASAEAIEQIASERVGWAAPGLSDTLRRSEKAVRDRHLPGAESLRLIQELHDHAQQLGLIGVDRENVQWR